VRDKFPVRALPALPAPEPDASVFGRLVTSAATLKLRVRGTTGIGVSTDPSEPVDSNGRLR
jgi:hypothetical protein